MTALGAAWLKLTRLRRTLHMVQPIGIFWRVLLTVLVTTLVVLGVFGVIFYADRNRAIAELSAQLIAPALQQELGRRVDPVPIDVAYRAAQRPPAAVTAATWIPRFKVLTDALRAERLPVNELAVTRQDDELVLWIELTDPKGAVRWLGFSNRVLEPAYPRRALLGWMLMVVVLCGASFGLAWQLSRPLKTLQERIESAFVPGWERSGTSFSRPGQSRWWGAAAEISAIDQAFERLCAQLLRQERERELLLAGISHDLRSPLTRIRTATELLPDTPDTQARREGIVRNVELADELVGSLLDHVRLGTLPLDQEVSLSLLVQEALQRRPDLLSVVQADIAPLVRLSRAHPLLLERIVANLLENALRHGQPPVGLKVWQDSQQAWIEVSDHGPGFDAQDQNQLAEAFFRGDPSRHQAGLGLGLTVVQQGVHRLGGQWSVTRHEGVFCIRVRLPLNPGLTGPTGRV